MTDGKQPYADGYDSYVEDAAANSPRAAMRMLRRKLRGRWWLVGILAPCLGTICVILGYTAVAPQYRSTGIVRFARHTPAILYTDRDEQPAPDFTSFVATQPKFIQSDQVLAAAVGQLGLDGVSWPSGQEGVAVLKESLEVGYRRGDQHITLSATHHDPHVAKRAVDAVLMSYKQLCRMPEGISRVDRINVLEQRERELEGSLRGMRAELLELTNQYGVDTIDQLHQEAVDELITVEDSLRSIDLAIRQLQPAETETAAEAPLAPFGRFGLTGFQMDQLTVMLTPEQENAPVASAERTIKLTPEQIALHAEIQIWREKYGPNHPRIRTLEEQLALLEMNRALESRQPAEPKADQGAVDNTTLATASLAQLTEIRAETMSRRADLQDEIHELACQGIDLATVQDRIATVNQQLTDTRERLDEVRVENADLKPALLSIAAYGDLPVTALSDRRLALAIISALFGISVTIAMVAGIGIIDPRCRYAEELEDVEFQLPMLALLPDLNGKQTDREALAAHAVHQLRNFLETHNGEQLRGVYAVTSVDRGEGRTSLTLALGASFAAAGCRTLLIDSDVVQCNLTEELDLVNRPGLCESVGQAEGVGQMYQTRTRNLWALPVGAARDFNPHDLSYMSLKRLVEAVRGQFDAVIIDTGPVTASLEGGLAAAVADQVLMLVSRFQSRRLVSTGLQELSQLGANCIGYVFNRAARSDFRRLPVLETTPTSKVASLVGNDVLKSQSFEELVAEPVKHARAA